MIDIVIPLIEKTRYGHTELKYCLRAIEKNLTGYGKIWIVGHKPNWITNIHHIPATDPHDIPDQNIRDKIKLACETPEVSGSFLFFNDDHFLLQQFQAETFPYYHMGTIADYVKDKPLASGYGNRCRNVIKHHGDQAKMFDVHTPIIYQKEAFLKHVCFPWNVKEGYVIKSLYANAMKIEGEYTKDGKFNGLPPAGTKVFSTYPHVKHAIFRFLSEHFPDKSKYEI